MQAWELLLNSEEKMLFYWYHLNSVAVSFKRQNWPGPTSHAYFICSPRICVFCSASSTYGTTLYGKEEWCHLPSNSRIWTHTPTVRLEIHSTLRGKDAIWMFPELEALIFFWEVPGRVESDFHKEKGVCGARNSLFFRMPKEHTQSVSHISEQKSGK